MQSRASSGRELRDDAGRSSPDLPGPARRRRNLEPPHQLGFTCTPETFAELTEREGIIPAPYLARGDVGPGKRARPSSGAFRARTAAAIGVRLGRGEAAEVEAAGRGSCENREEASGRTEARRRKKDGAEAPRPLETPLRRWWPVLATSSTPAPAGPSSTRQSDRSSAALRRARAGAWRSGRDGSGCASRTASTLRSR